MKFQDHPKLLPATGAIGFHRDTQNGGFAQSIWNNRRDMDAVLGAYRTIGGRAIEAIPVIEEAWAFFRTRPLGQSEENDELPNIEDVFDGDEPRWRDLNSRYFSIPPSDTGLDAVEGAVIHYAIAHPADFAEMAVRAILSND